MTKIRELLVLGWCKGCLAQNKDGDHIDPASDEAVSFSLLGALYRVSGTPVIMGLPEGYGEFSALFHGKQLSVFNDEASSVEEILTTLDQIGAAT